MAKGQGISLNAIIIAALALLVLVVLAMVFTGRLGVFTQEAKSCATMGGTCVADEIDCSGEEERVMSRYSCTDETSVCCLRIVREEE